MYQESKTQPGLFLLVFFVIGLITVGCEGGKTQTSSSSKETTDTVKEYKYYADWAVNTEYLQQGCESGYDCIKSIDNPKFTTLTEATLMQDEDLVVGIKIGDVVRCYPHRILDWHEMVNDVIGDKKFTINYCPLTGSAMAWNRVVNGKETTFGVSGLLFNSNVIPYDRETGSHWSQMKQQCVNGEFFRQKIECYQIVETTWKTWKQLYPGSQVQSFETGHSRHYDQYPYFDYKENEEVMFDVEFDNDTLFQKERLFGIIDAGSRQNEKVKCYRFDNFKNGVTVLEDSVFGKKIVLIGSKQDNFITAFENNLNGTQLKLKPVSNTLPAICSDENGNLFDVFGNCIEGSLKGAQLKQVDGFIAYWFAWAAFYPEAEVY
ncbi:MAG: DUF3179 domain-containing protein [Chitinophagales bacterium]